MNTITLEEKEIPANLSFLLLEDEEHYQQHMLGLLKELGFTGTIDQVYDVQTAMKQSSEQNYDFYFSDWNLPDGKGIQFLEFVRTASANDKSPFVMVTTMDDIQDILDATEKGSDGYIVKPYNSGDVSQALSFAYHKRNK